MSNRESVERLIAAYNRRDTAAILAVFAEDAIYHNIPLAPTTGKAAIRAEITRFVGNCSEIDWVVHAIAEAADGTVLTERTDAFVTGGRRIALPVMGVFEFRNGKIAAWRDYFDVATYQRQAAG